MKIWPLFTLGLLAPLTSGLGQTANVAQPSSPVFAAKTPVKKPDTKKAEPEPVIEGITIARGARFLGIAVVGGSFRLSFYDEKKKPVAPDVTRAALRWPVKYQPLDERAVLNPAPDGVSLTSAKIVRPPLLFKLYITLPKSGGDEVQDETFIVDFRG